MPKAETNHNIEYGNKKLKLDVSQSNSIELETKVISFLAIEAKIELKPIEGSTLHEPQLQVLVNDVSTGSIQSSRQYLTQPLNRWTARGIGSSKETLSLVGAVSKTIQNQIDRGLLKVVVKNGKLKFEWV